MHWLGPGLQEARGPVLGLEAALVPGGSRSTPQAILLSLCTALSLAAGLGLRVGEHFVLTSPDKRVRGSPQLTAGLCSAQGWRTWGTIPTQWMTSSSWK